MIFSKDATTDSTKIENEKSVNFNNSNEKVSLRINAFFEAMPITYDGILKFQTYDLNGIIFIGAKYQKFSMGGETSFLYIMHTGLDPEIQSLYGAFFLLRFDYNIYYTPLYWLEFWGGFGISWLASAFNKNSYGSITQNFVGFSMTTGISFKPIRYLSFDIPIYLDLYFKDSKTYPFFMMTGRIKFHPYIEWANINTEFGFFTWSYDDMYNNFNTVSFIWRIGAGFEIDLNKNISNMKTLVTQIKDKNSSDKTSKDNLKFKLWQLRNAKENKQVSFQSIIFEADKDVLKSESYPILDEIAKVLVDRSNMYVEIGGYTNSRGLVEDELILSVKRAQAVAIYLNKKGVPFNNMKVAGYGSYSIETNENKTEDNRKVVISVVKILEK